MIGNHACANRGDCAIARGLWQYLDVVFQNNQIVMLSRFPVSSAYLLQKSIRRDFLSDYYQALKGQSFLQRVKRSLIGRFMTSWLSLIVNFRQKWRIDLTRLLPDVFANELSFYRDFDLIVQVGGSNLVDLYGPTQFDSGLLAVLSGRPLILVGHSLGPFEDSKSRYLAKTLLESSASVMVREPVSAEILQKCNIHPRNLIVGGDTAWLLQDIKLSKQPRSKKVIITVRRLAPFERRVGISQHEYNMAIARLADDFINHGAAVEFLSTCTGIDNYGNDDRMLALSIRELCKTKSEIYVEMAELNDLELMQRFSDAKLVIATRLHSAILALNCATPAIALAYEHKTSGIMQQLNLADWSFPVRAVCEEPLQQTANSILTLDDRQFEDLQSALEQSVCNVRHRVESSILTALKEAGIDT